MTAQTGISVRRNDIFVSLVGLPLGSGKVLPAGVAFVCRRGGHQCQLVFQHPYHGGLVMVTMSKRRIAEELRRGVRQELPIRLAAAFGYPVDHIPRARLFAGKRYYLSVPMPSLEGTILPVGTVVTYHFVSGLHVLTIEGKMRQGFPARLVFGEEDLRILSPCMDANGTATEAVAA